MAQEQPGALVWDKISAGYALVAAVAYDANGQIYYALDSGSEDGAKQADFTMEDSMLRDVCSGKMYPCRTRWRPAALVRSAAPVKRRA